MIPFFILKIIKNYKLEMERIPYRKKFDSVIKHIDKLIVDYIISNVMMDRRINTEFLRRGIVEKINILKTLNHYIEYVYRGGFILPDALEWYESGWSNYYYMSSEFD